MKTLLIIYPHWHPINLAGVHRPRLVGNFLNDLDWNPVVLTVQEKYYEENLDPDFERTFSKDFEVHRVGAWPVTRPRVIGDIGLRAFFQLYRGALNLIGSKHVDFIWIPIPSFYSALLGRLLYRKARILYGIDYIDPWVRDISTRRDWRHRLSNGLARLLEPIAVRKASLITGVSYDYYEPALKRNFKRRTVLSVREKSDKQFSSSITQRIYRSTDPPVYHTAFPYGFDPGDHQIILDNIQYPWEDKKSIKPWIYAGAFLPNSRVFVQLFFEVIAEMRRSEMWDKGIRLYFIGTGAYLGKTVKEYAEEKGIVDIVSEARSRYPYLHILNYLSAADTVLVIGSTEKHYTASKVYQALLSERSVWAIFHQESSAVKVMEECQADQYLVRYQDGMTDDDLRAGIKEALTSRLKNNSWSPDLKALDKYSARESARKLVEGMEAVISLKRG